MPTIQMWIEKLFGLIGRICFPHQQDWQQRRNAKILVATIVVCIVVGLVLRKFLMMMNRINR